MIVPAPGNMNTYQKPQSQRSCARSGGGEGSVDSVSFLATSDTGSTAAARAVFADMGAEITAGAYRSTVSPVRFALHGGDATYGMDGADAAKRAAMAMGFYAAAQPVASAVPMMTALGNHDLLMFRSQNPQQQLSAEEMPFLLRPEADARSDGVMTAPPAALGLYYSFQEGGVRVIVLNTEERYGVGSAQQTWLSDQMRSANAPTGREICPWVVVMMHRPMYSASEWYENTREPGAVGTAGDLAAELETILVEGGVVRLFSLIFSQLFSLIVYKSSAEFGSTLGQDLVLAGHVHHYERTHATKHNGGSVIRPVMTKDQVDRYDRPGAPVYILRAEFMPSYSTCLTIC